MRLNLQSALKDTDLIQNLRVVFPQNDISIILVLEGEYAITKNRDLLCDTDPTRAIKGTIRADFANSIDANAVHGSDSQTSAIREIEYFFKAEEVLNK